MYFSGPVVAGVPGVQIDLQTLILENPPSGEPARLAYAIQRIRQPGVLGLAFNIRSKNIYHAGNHICRTPSALKVS